MILLGCNIKDLGPDTGSGTCTQVIYPDADGDSYGDLRGATDWTADCNESLPTGHAVRADDCDDNDPNINPDRGENCNGLDDDCDTRIDEAPVDAPDYYEDGDGDGYGNPAVLISDVCTQPTGYVTDGNDCDDTVASTHPAGNEICGGYEQWYYGESLDEDCDGAIDEGMTQADMWEAATDADADGYALEGATPIMLCSGSPGYASWRDGYAYDCDDSDSVMTNGITELCRNRLDDDCDGTIDESTDCVTLHSDDDGDGFLTDEDCDDADSSINRGSTENALNGTDDDCDGSIDETS